MVGMCGFLRNTFRRKRITVVFEIVIHNGILPEYNRKEKKWNILFFFARAFFFLIIAIYVSV